MGRQRQQCMIDNWTTIPKHEINVYFTSSSERVEYIQNFLLDSPYISAG